MNPIDERLEGSDVSTRVLGAMAAGTATLCTERLIDAAGKFGWEAVVMDVATMSAKVATHGSALALMMLTRQAESKAIDSNPSNYPSKYGFSHSGPDDMSAWEAHGLDLEVDAELIHSLTTTAKDFIRIMASSDPDNMEPTLYQATELIVELGNNIHCGMVLTRIIHHMTDAAIDFHTGRESKYDCATCPPHIARACENFNRSRGKQCDKTDDIDYTVGLRLVDKPEYRN